MSAVEIDEALTALPGQPFDAEISPFAVLLAFGDKDTTLKHLHKGETNRSDIGGVLQFGNIHIVAAAPGGVTQKLAASKAGPTTARAKAQFVLTVGGDTVKPVLPLTAKNRANLTGWAEDILLANEARFPATIADVHNPSAISADLRATHDRNDEERLEKLFEMYTATTAGQKTTKQKKTAQ